MDLNKLNGLIVEKGKSRKTLAKDFGITVQAIGKKLNGTSKITVEDAEKFCKYIPIDDLVLRNQIFLQ